MVFVELTSGLGNQLFQYAAARSFAFTHGQKLILDNRSFLGNSYRKPRLSYFQTGAFLNLPAYPLAYHLVDFLTSKSITLIKEHQWWELQYFPEAINSKNILLKGGFGSFRYFSNHTNIIQNELRLKEKFKHRIKDKLKELKGCNSVAIHIRKGDYIDSSEAKKIFAELGIAYYQKAIEHINEKVDNPIFFIFSNDMNWVKNYFSPAINVKLVFISSENNWEDYEEFEMMRNCKHQIIGNSTFSWWAAFLNSNPDKIIIQPKQWYVHEQAQGAYSANQLIGYMGILL